MLPDDVLLEIFSHHRLNTELESWSSGPWEWRRLVHVCRRWRTLIFSSPYRLKLTLVFTYNKPDRKNLDCWPDLPLSIRYNRSSQYTGLSLKDEENIITALEHPRRICEISLVRMCPLSKKLVPLMQDPFPMLEALQIESTNSLSDVIPSTFLGGSAPQLRHIYLKHTPFPTLSQFLLTAPALVSLRLLASPTMGYISPEALVAGLGAKPNLEILEIDWSCSGPGPQSPPTPHPQTRVALPALTEFMFTGDNEYLEDLIARIDTPNVEQFFVTLFDRRTFSFPRLAEFISRTEHMTSSPHETSISLGENDFTITHYFASLFPSRTFELQIPCDESTGQMNPLIHACRQLSLLLSNVERLDIGAYEMLWDLHDKQDTVQWLDWLELFSVFGAVRKLGLRREVVPFATSALAQSSNMGYGAVFPSLRDLQIICSNSPAPQMESFMRQFFLTAPALVSFRLFTCPAATGNLTPDILVAGLDAMPKLEILEIDWFVPCPGKQSPCSPYPAETRVALPALAEFRYQGDDEYLEDLISRIDSPNVERLFVTLSHPRTLELPRLAEFISHTAHLTSPHRASIRLWRVCFAITYHFVLPLTSRIFELQILYHTSARQMQALIQECRQLSLLLSKVGRLDIEANKVLSDWRDKPDLAQWLDWLELFSLFGAVQMLELVGEVIPFAASALEQSSNIGYEAVFPFLRDLHMRCLDSSAPQIESFLAFRRHSGRVVSIHYTGAGNEGHYP